MSATTLESVKKKPDEGVIEQLERLLDDAKAGDIRELVGCARMPDGSMITFDSGAKDGVYTMLGGLTDLSMSYREKCIE